MLARADPRMARELGRVDGLAATVPTRDDVADLLEDTDNSYGRVTHVRPAGVLSATPAYW